MKYIKYTYIDAKTNICANKEPLKNGPKEPEIKGLLYLFSAERKYPTDVPEFFGVCDDDANTFVEGCFGEITEAEFIQERQAEINARKKYPSWVINQTILNNHLMLLNDVWMPPVPYPNDEKFYKWDENTASWKEIETILFLGNTET
jgi:hypothetical protein